MRRGALNWLSTHYDESEWNNCFIIYTNHQIAKESASEPAGNMFQFVKQTPEFCMNVSINVCLKFQGRSQPVFAGI